MAQARVDPWAAQKWASQKQRDFLLKDFFTFAKFSGLCPDIEEDPYREICDWLESRLPNKKVWKKRRGIFLIPRLLFKTSLVSALCIYAFLVDNDIRITLGRATTLDSQATLRGIKTGMQIPAITSAFGDLRGKFEKWTDEFIILKDRTAGMMREPTIDTTGLGHSMTGTHVDLCILDDLVNEQNFRSAIEMERANILIESAEPVLERWGSLLIVGTRWGDNDCYGKIIEADDSRIEARGEEGRKWDRYIHSCFDEREGRETEAWIPYVLSKAQIEDLRESTDPKLFAAWYLNKAHADDDVLISLAYIHYFDGEFVGGPFAELELDDTPENKQLRDRFGGKVPLSVIGLIDPALTIGPKSDFTGIVFVGFDPSGNWWVLGAYEIKKRPSERLDFVLYQARRFAPVMIALENADMDGVLLEEKLRDIGLPCKVVSFDPHLDRKKITRDPRLAPRGMTGKFAQIEKLQPILSARKVFISRKETQPLVRQLLRYPHLDHDDVLDAFSMAQAYAGKMILEASKPPEKVWLDIERREYDLEGLNFDGTERDAPRANPAARLPRGAWAGPFTTLG